MKSEWSAMFPGTNGPLAGTGHRAAATAQASAGTEQASAGTNQASAGTEQASAGPGGSRAGREINSAPTFAAPARLWIVLLGVAWPLAGAAAQCDPHWVLVSTTGPSPRAGCAMAYDAARQRVVLFGGNTTPASGETWTWDGVAWTRAALTGPQPGPRRNGKMAFDAARGECVMFGSEGQNDTGTWLWNGAEWRFGGTDPGNGQSGGSMGFAYDPSRQRVVMHGGRTWNQSTREWNGSAWTLVSTATPPAGRDSHTAAFLPSRGRVVIFGGYAEPGDFVNEMWEWDGAAWSPVPQASPPPGRASHAMAYDAARARLVVVGGTDADGPCGFTDTWEFDGFHWQPMNSGAGFPGVAGGGAVYDEARQHVVLFGGLFNDCSARSGATWVWTAGPALTSRPQPASTCPAAPVTFSITAAGAGPFSYQWRKDTVPIDTIANPSAATATLSLTNVQPADAGSYDCIVTNACGSVTSNAATLTVCPADFNCDGFLDFFDIDAFVTAFESGDAAADFNGDGFLDFFDADAFVEAFEAGC